MREEEKNRSSQNSSFKRFMKKRWAFPAIYIASAAIILTGVLWYQNSSINDASDSEEFGFDQATDIPGKNQQIPAIEVNQALENFKMPVADPDAVSIQKQFYKFDGKAEEQEAALVFYNNTFHPNTGIDITMGEGEAFDVQAAMSGKIIKVEEDALLGNVIEIEHDKGIVTQYQSVTETKVKVGDQVKQGDVIAKAGESLYNEDAGVHLHFEIRKDQMAVNPLEFFEKPLSALQDLEPAVKDDSKASDKDKKTETAPADDDKSKEDGSDDRKDESDGSSENGDGDQSDEQPKEETTPSRDA